MNKFLKKMMYRTDDERFNPLMYLYFMTSLAYGVSFVFFEGVKSSAYVSMSEVAEYLPHIWGLVLLVAMVLNFITLVYRIGPLASATSLTGFCAYLYLTIIYFQLGFYSVAFAVSIPNMLFWVWYYLRVGYYIKFVSRKS